MVARKFETVIADSTQWSKPDCFNIGVNILRQHFHNNGAIDCLYVVDKF